MVWHSGLFVKVVHGRFHASTAGGMGSIPGWGTKIPQASLCIGTNRQVANGIDYNPEVDAHAYCYCFMTVVILIQ